MNKDDHVIVLEDRYWPLAASNALPEQLVIATDFSQYGFVELLCHASRELLKGVDYLNFTWTEHD
jgi:hypothetical protein